MKKPSLPDPERPDDRALVEFLRQHHPTPPLADPRLEQMIMQTITLQSSRCLTAIPRWGRVVPIVMAAMTVVAWGGWRWLVPPNLTPQEISELESFMADNWRSSVSRSDDSVLLSDNLLTTSERAD